MGFLFLDSLETYTTFSTDGPLRGWSSTSWPDITSTQFKDGTQCIRLEGNETVAWEIPVADEPGPVSLGMLSFWFRAGAIPTSRRTIVAMNSSGTYVLVFVIEADGTLQWRFNSANVGPASTFALVANRWYHFEVRWEFVDSTFLDSCLVLVDGEQVLNIGDGVDTKFSTFNEIEGFRFHGQGLTGTWFYVDSPIFWNAVASSNWSDLRGVMRIETLAPDANGPDNDLVGSDANSVDNYLQVDEIADFHDADTTYNEGGGIGDKDSYNFPDMTANDVGEILGVQIAMVSKKTTSGGPNFTPFYVDGGIDRDGTEHVLTNGVYSASAHMFDENPEDAAPWTSAKISSGNFGLRVT